MKIVSWNVNGLRAIHRKGNWDWLVNESPDIFCLQEIKATPDQLPAEVREPQGYHAYFNAPDQKKGYSGTAIYTKKKPIKVVYGMDGDKSSDEEGRMVAVHFNTFILLTVYFPNGGGGADRLAYKLEFYDRFLAYIEKLRKKKSVIFCGDVNTAHEAIDLARPKANEKNTGFLPEERAWLDEVVNKGWVDVFRHFNPDTKDAYTYWDMKTRARDRNVGWRIDYFFVSSDMQKKVTGITHHTKALGSDHCPLSIEVAL